MYQATVSSAGSLLREFRLWYRCICGMETALHPHYFLSTLESEWRLGIGPSFRSVLRINKILTSSYFEALGKAVESHTVPTIALEVKSDGYDLKWVTQSGLTITLTVEKRKWSPSLITVRGEDIRQIKRCLAAIGITNPTVVYTRDTLFTLSEVAKLNWNNGAQAKVPLGEWIDLMNKYSNR